MVLFNLHLFVVIHKSLCEDSLQSLNDDDEIDQVFDEQIEEMKKLLFVNKQLQNQRFSKENITKC